MTNRRLAPRVGFLLLWLAIIAAGLVPPKQEAKVQSSTWLRFGQSIALSDFDEDGLIDQAQLHRDGMLKTVEVILSGAVNPVVLPFDTRGADYGSIFARDVDNDGSTDLIWTDLLHWDDVVVWFGDGNGKFERLPNRLYADAFTLFDVNLGMPDGVAHEPSIAVGTYRWSVGRPNQTPIELVAVNLSGNRLERVETLDPALSQTAVRGPPFLS